MMILPYNVDVPMERVPWANWALMGFISLVSIFVFFDDRRRSDPETAERIQQLMDQAFNAKKDKDQAAAMEALTRELEKMPLPGPGGHPLTLQPLHFHWWQVITSQFVHANFVHLIGNLIFLFAFGNAINAKLGHVFYLVSYVGIGVIPDLVLLMTGDTRPSLGASGAIWGVIGIYLVLYPRNDISIWYWIFIYTGLRPISGFWIILYFMAWDILMLYLSGGLALGSLAHMVGAFSGILFGIILITTGLVQSDSDEENLLQALGFLSK
jgi:membrane associated rhomboid family serine protease